MKNEEGLPRPRAETEGGREGGRANVDPLPLVCLSPIKPKTTTETARPSE